MEAHAITVPFSDADLHHFQTEDFAAGRAVVSLMVGIFSLGVVIYTIVALSCLR